MSECEVCAHPTKSLFGICQRTKDCRRLRVQRVRSGTPNPTVACEVCGRPTDAAGRVCKATPACRRERYRQYEQSQQRAGQERHPALYGTWHAMVRRCDDPSATGYSYYGGRGVSARLPW